MMRRFSLLVAVCLALVVPVLCGCRQPPPSPSPPPVAVAASSASAQDGAPLAVREQRLRQDGEPVTSLSYDARVFFDSDQDRPRPGAGTVLDALSARLKREPGATHVAVLGHTDAVGSDAYNLALSRRRALAVLRALVARGIDRAAIEAVAVGKRQPVASDDTEQGRARNRRVEFLISPSVGAIRSLIASRPTGMRIEAQHPAALQLRTRRPDTVSRAPLGDPVSY